jgi:CRISPR/Cas system-associated endonuclease/helicase Cas3
VVEYGRLASFFGQVKINKSAFGNAAPKPQELLQLLFSKTTEEERQQGAAYFAAYAQRVSEILADAELVREFEGRIAATP